MAYPVSRRLTRHSGRYGARKPIRLPNGTYTPSWHGGEDFTPLVPGTRLPVYAVGRGTVVIADKTAEPGDFSGLDVGIRLDGDGSIWWYGHLSRIDVNLQQRVTDGQQIGLMGATGRVTGVHLHLERHWPSLNVETDPWPYIKDEPDNEGLTSSWQTGNPPAASGDAGATVEDLMAFKPDLFINRTSGDGPRGLGIAIFANGVVKALPKAQWDAWQILGADKPTEVKGDGHWSFLLAQAADVRAASSAKPAAIDEEALRAIVRELVEAMPAANAAEVAKAVVESLGGVTLADGEAERIADAVIDEQRDRLAE